MTDAEKLELALAALRKIKEYHGERFVNWEVTAARMFLEAQTVLKKIED